jgi:hypothetical protein
LQEDFGANHTTTFEQRPNIDEVRSRFTFSWQYVSYGVPEQL